jgi:hypothetical protein
MVYSKSQFIVVELPSNEAQTLAQSPMGKPKKIAERVKLSDDSVVAAFLNKDALKDLVGWRGSSPSHSLLRNPEPMMQPPDINPWRCGSFPCLPSRAL